MHSPHRLVAALLNIILLQVILSFCFFQDASAQKKIPELKWTPVHDEAHVLSQATVAQLESTLKQFEDSTTNQIAIFITPSLEGENLEDYSIRVAEANKLGQADKDNGVLLLIAIDDHKMRIEVGEGLEGPLPDAICNRIIRNEMAPNFRRGDFDAGVTAAIDAIMQAIKGEYVADEVPTEGIGDIQMQMSWKERILIGMFVFGILGIFTFIGLFVKGCAGWFLYAFLIPFYATFPMAVLGTNGGLSALGVYAIGFPVLKLIIGRTPWGQRMMKKMESSNNRRGGGGWSSGSGWFGGGGGSSGWSGGGGFSGSGGSFGGGGSSGSW